MGYFFSLSKSTTEHWLNGCELLPLVCGLVLAYGAAGEYLEEHGKLPGWMRWTREPKFIFVWMVAISLFGEFAGDAGVYIFSGHLQSISDQEIKDANSRALDAATSARNAKGDAAQAHNLALGALDIATPAKETADRLGRHLQMSSANCLLAPLRRVQAI